MRYTLKQVLAKRSWDAFLNWWQEWPVRRSPFWDTLFFQPGQGWLRWSKDEASELVYIQEDLSYPEYFPVYPPLRRAWIAFTNTFACLTMAIKGELDWKAVIPAPDDLRYLRDPDRHHSLWETR